MPETAAKQLVVKLSRSQIFKDYETAFARATGLPLALRPVESWRSAFEGSKNQNPFCLIMAEQSRSCAACLEAQQTVADNVGDGPFSTVCFAGLTDTGVPLKVGDRVLGILQTGQIFLEQPDRALFDRTARRLIDWGLKVDLLEVEEAFFNTRVLSGEQYTAMVKLLSIFSEHLALVANQILVQDENAEPPMILRAKDFINRNQAEDISLGDVAKAVNTSTFYFCKMFRKATGLHFTDYLSRVRVEKAKNLLLNPNLRVSEVAFEVGFQSLTHFNRVFRKIVGKSPTAYRAALPVGAASPVRNQPVRG